MSDVPNLKKLILEYTLDQTDEDDTVVSMWDLADESGYDVTRLQQKVRELDPIFDWGISPRVPWLGHNVSRRDIKRKLSEYDNSCPHCKECGSPKKYIVAYYLNNESSMWVCPNTKCNHE
jgi:FPC/CPF motif-containing protein YcgG